MPFPQVEGPRPEKKDDKRKGKTAIITASPYKLQLELEEHERQEKEREKIKKQQAKVAKKSLFKIPAKKQVIKKKPIIVKVEEPDDKNKKSHTNSPKKTRKSFCQKMRKLKSLRNVLQ